MELPDEVEYEGLPTGTSLGVNMMAGALVSLVQASTTIPGSHSPISAIVTL